jgi:hypothetical protein
LHRIHNLLLSKAQGWEAWKPESLKAWKPGGREARKPKAFIEFGDDNG